MLYTLETEETDVILQIRSYIWDRDDRGTRWYVGVAEDAEKQLFRRHGIRREGDDWISVPVANPELARRIMKYLIRGLGVEGDIESLPRGPVHVYAYRKRAHTRP